MNILKNTENYHAHLFALLLPLELPQTLMLVEVVFNFL